MICWPPSAPISPPSSTGSSWAARCRSTRVPGRCTTASTATCTPFSTKADPAMLPASAIEQLAAELHESEKSRVQVEHFSKRFPDMTIEDGYAVSRAWVKRKLAEGRTVRGHKIGLTSRAMQVSSQIDEPDYGTLLDDMFFESGGD